MSNILPERMTVRIDGDFVVFRIGMRINAFWKLHRWLPVFVAMPRMLRELEADPESGLLGYQRHFGLRNQILAQHWRSFAHLREYARDVDSRHLPARKRFNRGVGSGGDVGIWHETHLVSDGAYEAVYNNVPPFALGTVGELVSADGRLETAAGRLGHTEGDDAAVGVDGTVLVD